jgi:DNA-binding NarL/FixJ family response regulator
MGAGARIIIMAARGDRKLALETLRAGANGFLLKNCMAAELIEALNRVHAGSLYVSPVLQFEKVFSGSSRNAPEHQGDPVDQLSSREYQVFQLLVEGYRAKDIAVRLSLSPKTVDTYRASLMRKLDIHDLPGLVKFAIQRDLITA